MKQLVMANPRLGIRFAVERYALDVAVGAGSLRGQNGEGAVGMMEQNFAQLRCSEEIDGGAVGDGIETHGGKNEPGGHLTRVVVPAETIRRSVVERMGNLTNEVLGFPRFAGIIVHVDGGMTGLVAVGVLSD